MLELGIDELTIVLRLAKAFDYLLATRDWIDIAKHIIGVFCEKAKLLEVFGEEQPLANKLPLGYNFGFTYGEHNFYFAIAFHEYRSDMGIVVKFSATALGYYCEKTGKKPYELFQMIQHDLYTSRITRADLTVDYIDENIDITDIYNSYTDDKIAVCREYISKKDGSTLYKKVPFIVKGFKNGNEVQTMYLGSKQSDLFLRIYDKKAEQLDKKGTNYQKALACKDWTRFEGVFRKKYAHQIGDALLKIQNDDDYGNLIACTMIQRYRFKDVVNGKLGSDTDFSALLLMHIQNKNFILKSDSSKNYELVQSIIHLLTGSGTITTIYKIKMIWGEDAMETFIQIMRDSIDIYVPNDDCKYWLRTNKDDYLLNFPIFDLYFKDIIAPWL